MFYFSSDIHFGDEPTLKTEQRPFKNVKAFDKYVIKLWNKQATKNDTIFVVGDFADCDGAQSESWRKTLGYVKKIKAKVVLIMGNNEQRIVKYFFENSFEKFRQFCLNLGFKDVKNNVNVNIKGLQFYLVHKPVHCKTEMLNLFGHTHRSSGIYKPYGFNVGCDLNHFRLYSEDDIMHLLNLKEKFWDKDKDIAF